MREAGLPDAPSFRLDGRRALVTGAGSGLGRASAVALARAGAEVLLAGRRPEPLEALAEALGSIGCNASALPMDITDVDNTRRRLASAGRLDVLVNSAGTNIPQPMEAVTPDSFDTIIGLNLRAAYFLSQTVATGMRAAGIAGSIINVSSQMGHVGGRDRTVYCASKFAVEGMTRAMALEFGRAGIRVNTVCPTFIETEMTRETLSDPEQRARIESQILLGRLGTVGDIMGPVLFLASDAAALVTGASLLVDGGWTAV